MDREQFARNLIIKYLIESPKDLPIEEEKINLTIKALCDIWDIDPENFPDCVLNESSLVDMIPLPESNEEIINDLIKMSNKELGSGNFDLARNYLTEALQLDPNNERILFRRAIALIKDNNYSAAINDLNTVISIDKFNANAYAYLGFCYWSLGQPDQSRAIYHEGLDKCPDKEILLQYLAFLGPESQPSLPNISVQIANQKGTPEFNELMKNPKIASIVESIEEDPSIALKYSGDSDFMALLRVLLK